MNNIVKLFLFIRLLVKHNKHFLNYNTLFLSMGISRGQNGGFEMWYIGSYISD